MQERDVPAALQFGCAIFFFLDAACGANHGLHSIPSAHLETTGLTELKLCEKLNCVSDWAERHLQLVFAYLSFFYGQGLPKGVWAGRRDLEQSCAYVLVF